MDLNKKIEIKLKYILMVLILLLISIGVSVNEIKSNTNELSEQTKLTKTITDSLTNKLTKNKSTIDSLVTSFGIKENKLIQEKDSLSVAINIVKNSKTKIKYLNRIVTKYDKDGNITEVSKVDSGEKTEEKTETYKNEYTETKNRLSIIELEKDSIINKLSKTIESKDSLTTLVSKLQYDSTHQKYDTLIKNQITIGNNIISNIDYNVKNEIYLEYKRNFSKTAFGKLGLNHNTYDEEIKSFKDINNYKVYIGIGYNFNL